MSNAFESEFVGSRGTLYRRPRPWWHFVFPSFIGLGIVLFGLFGEWFVCDARTPLIDNGHEIQPPSTWNDRWPFLVFCGILVVLGPIVPLSYALTSDLEIREQGLRVNDYRIDLESPPAKFFDMSNHRPTSLRRFLAEIQRQMFPLIPWKHVKSCRWGLFEVNRNLLMITGVNERHLEYRIPEADRARVEAILRQFGKWRD